MNDPTTFCSLMNQVFHENLNKFIVIYLDAIVVYNATVEKHQRQLQLVFEKLRVNQLYVKRENCVFA